MYTITEEGRLVRHTAQWITDEMRRLGGGYKIELETGTDIEFHGDFTFYTIKDGMWIEFLARFTEGQLVWIKLIEQRRMGGGITRCVR